MLNFRIKNGSRVPTTISATHLKMHALFWSTLQQGRFVHISPTNHHFPSLLRVQDEDRGRRHRGLKEVHKRCGENATAAWNVSFWN
ncbi:uncharacterized protein LOC110917101 isoform X5 [Helianthus annuus]|uniref:uncharacterized protein LOC110872200 isoform X5 n=1 Tax=Helianthus annuus TaxID=4232 RepID=UPI000B904A6C|nr:uncharacterized protein LOC110872200 isoform X5 [Helianthus annuus]XP_022017412.1 uncharacterized protein LOC110917101 isoform X5 [Helianthus annuus]